MERKIFDIVKNSKYIKNKIERLEGEVEKIIVITNNPDVREKYKNIYFVEGGFEDLLLKVRDMVYMGHELVTHPLGASLRMMFSPYRSVVVTDEKVVPLNELHAEIIGKAIESYKNVIGVRMKDVKNMGDYAKIDYLLLKNVLQNKDIF